MLSVNFTRAEIGWKTPHMVNDGDPELYSSAIRVELIDERGRI